MKPRDLFGVQANSIGGVVKQGNSRSPLLTRIPSPSAEAAVLPLDPGGRGAILLNPWASHSESFLRESTAEELSTGSLAEASNTY